MKFKFIPVVLSTLLVTSSAVPYLAHPIQVEAAEYKYEKYQLDLLAQVNFERKMVGLSPVKLHPLLCKSTVNHENYLKINGYWEGHVETKGNKGFTGKTHEGRIKSVGYKSGFSAYETITKTILEYNTTYTVLASVVNEDTGRKASRTWSFTTKEDPQINS